MPPRDHGDPIPRAQGAGTASREICPGDLVTRTCVGFSVPGKELHLDEKSEGRREGAVPCGEAARAPVDPESAKFQQVQNTLNQQYKPFRKE